MVGPFPRFATDSALDDVADFVRSVVETRPQHPVYSHYPRGRFSVRDWHLVHQPLQDLLIHPAVGDRLEAIAGEDLVLWRSKIFHKPPKSGELAWHQEWGAFNGEEIGNDRPALIPRDTSRNWNWTVWIALERQTPDLGPVRFVRGSHRQRYPWHHVPMANSAFFTSFLEDCDDVPLIVGRARSNQSVLGRRYVTALRSQRRQPLADGGARADHDILAHAKAKLTLPFDVDESTWSRSIR